MRFTKEEFIDAMTALETTERNIQKIESALGCSLINSILWESYNSQLKIIRCMCDIAPDCDMSNLDYYIFELDYGKKWEPGCVIDMNDNDIPLGNLENLYADLTSSWG